MWFLAAVTKREESGVGIQESGEILKADRSAINPDIQTSIPSEPELRRKNNPYKIGQARDLPDFSFLEGNQTAGGLISRSGFFPCLLSLDELAAIFPFRRLVESRLRFLVLGAGLFLIDIFP